MFKLAKCPKCENVVQQARLEHMDITDGKLIVQAFSASCPVCQTILGVVTDPRPHDNMLGKIAKALGIH